MNERRKSQFPDVFLTSISKLLTMKKIITLIAFILVCSLNLFAQQSVDQDTVEMADRLRADGKIYVVVGVVLIVLIGMLVYIVRLDGKIRKIERELKQ